VVNSDEELDTSDEDVDSTEGGSAEGTAAAGSGSEMSYLDVTSSEDTGSATDVSVGPSPGEGCTAGVTPPSTPV
jgi:hypothetical protein